MNAHFAVISRAVLRAPLFRSPLAQLLVRIAHRNDLGTGVESQAGSVLKLTHAARTDDAHPNTWIGHKGSFLAVLNPNQAADDQCPKLRTRYKFTEKAQKKRQKIT